MDCGPTCLRMVAKYYGKNLSLLKIREHSGINREGVSLLGISEAAEKVGFRTSAAQLSIETLNQLDLPAIVHWNKNHFVVLYKIQKTFLFYKKNPTYIVADPGKGIIKYDEAGFSMHWLSSSREGKRYGSIAMHFIIIHFFSYNYENTCFIFWLIQI